MLNINTNYTSYLVQRALNNATELLNASIEQMSTGFKINRAKDNAATHSIITNMNVRLSSYEVAEENTAMGLDMLATASSSLESIGDKMSRLRALAEQSLNGTYGNKSRKAINAEANAIIDEIERTLSTTEYNGLKLFEGVITPSSHISTASSMVNPVMRLQSSVKLASAPGTSSSPDPVSVVYSSSAPAAAPQAAPVAATSSGARAVSESENTPQCGFLAEITRRDTSEMTSLQSVDENTRISSGTYSISTADELAKLATMTNNRKIIGGEFVLSNDIDLSGIENWTPIGDSSNYFEGTFDGNGFVISNLTINSSDSCVGLFGSVLGRTIKNLGLENANITATSSYANVGGIVGSGSYFSISNCYVQGNITATGSNARVGGIAGDGGFSIENCIIKADIQTNSKNKKTGGVVGYNDYTLKIKNVSVLISSSSIINSKFCGLVENSSTSTININDCKYNSALSSLPDYIGASSSHLSANKPSSTENSVGFLAEITRRYTSTMTSLQSVDENTSILSGTYSISTAEELAKLATMTNNGKINGGEFVLSNDIDLSGIENWTPIGDSSNYFKGTFDGNGFVISNLTINSSDSCVGLFGSVLGRTIKNLGLENANITATSSYANVGGIVGSGSYFSISNCYVQGNITATGSNARVGGIAGDGGFSIENCIIKADIQTNSKNKKTGGIVGYSSDENISIKNVSVLATANSILHSRCIGFFNNENNLSSKPNIQNNIYSSSIYSLPDYYSYTEQNSAGAIAVDSLTPDIEIKTPTGTSNGPGVGFSGTPDSDDFNGSGTGGTDPGTGGTDPGTGGTDPGTGGTDPGTGGTDPGTGGTDPGTGGTETPPTPPTPPREVLPFTPVFSSQHNHIRLQVGIDGSESSSISFETTFGMPDLTMLRQIGSEDFDIDCLAGIDAILERINAKQVEFGSLENRLESVLESISTFYDNMISSRSTLRDADIAEVSSEYIRQQILQQASATLLATANQSPALALQLL